MLKLRGPLLIASNHPNSFLDAVILALLFDEPVHALARGDVFNKPFFTKFFSSLKILPVYRITEGAHNLHENYTTFDACEEIFKKNGVVLIFSEGNCHNEWHLRPLKKGTARLAINSWQKGIPVKVLPLSINYDSFHEFGKNIKIRIGEVITQDDIDLDLSNGKNIQLFNEKLQSQLQQLVIQIDSKDKAAIKKEFTHPVSSLKKILLIIPALIGWLVHAPIYYPSKKIGWNMVYHKDHVDSMVASLMFLSYPIYLTLWSLLVHWLIGGWWWLLVWLIFPFFAWSCVQLKMQAKGITPDP